MTTIDALADLIGKARRASVFTEDQNVIAARAIDGRYVLIPKDEIADVEVRVEREDKLHAGDGPEKCSARLAENPQWLRNHALNALALAEKIDRMNAEQFAKDEQRRKVLEEFGSTTWVPNPADSPLLRAIDEVIRQRQYIKELEENRG
jgi:hypothetical protein